MATVIANRPYISSVQMGAKIQREFIGVDNFQLIVSMEI